MFTKAPVINQEMLHARMMRGSEFLTASANQGIAMSAPNVPTPGIPLEVVEPKGGGDCLAPLLRPGIFVDFTGCEDLQAEFEAAAMKAGLSPSDSALDLIYLFANGELHLKV